MTSRPQSKVELCLIAFGIIIGIVGILHGSAEILQGGAIVEARSIEALPEGRPNAEFYRMTRGSPVFTLLTGLPYFALGLMAISVSIAMIVFSATWARVSWSMIAVFAVLSLGIFLFGAGRGTPIAISLPLIIFSILSLTMTGKKARSDSTRKTLTTLFWLFFGIHIVSWVGFFPGLFLMSFYAELPLWLVVVDFLAMPLGALAALTTGLMLDRTA